MLSAADKVLVSETSILKHAQSFVSVAIGADDGERLGIAASILDPYGDCWLSCQPIVVRLATLLILCLEHAWHVPGLCTWYYSDTLGEGVAPRSVGISLQGDELKKEIGISGLQHLIYLIGCYLDTNFSDQYSTLELYNIPEYFRVVSHSLKNLELYGSAITSWSQLQTPQLTRMYVQDCQLPVGEPLCATDFSALGAFDGSNSRPIQPFEGEFFSLCSVQNYWLTPQEQWDARSW